MVTDVLGVTLVPHFQPTLPPTLPPLPHPTPECLTSSSACCPVLRSQTSPGEMTAISAAIAQLRNDR